MFCMTLEVPSNLMLTEGFYTRLQHVLVSEAFGMTAIKTPKFYSINKMNSENLKGDWKTSQAWDRHVGGRAGGQSASQPANQPKRANQPASQSQPARISQPARASQPESASQPEPVSQSQSASHPKLASQPARLASQVASQPSRLNLGAKQLT